MEFLAGRLSAAVIATAVLSIFSPLSAAPGDLDLSFNGTGKVIANFGLSNEFCYSCAVQSDGKVLLAGGCLFDIGHRLMVLRCNADGSLDPTFNGTGKVLTSLGVGSSFATSVVVQPDGKILVTGQGALAASPPHYQIGATCLVRYHPDGSIDAGFGTNGVVMTPDYLLTPSLIPQGLGVYSALSPDGKIVVGGTDNGIVGGRICVFRYHPDGSLDTSFDGDGLVRLSSSAQGSLRGILVRPDGKIVLAWASGSYDARVLQLTAQGTLEVGFSGDGIARTDLNDVDFAAGPVLQEDGKIVVAGFRSVGEVFLARFTSGGELDSTFGENGRRALPLSGVKSLGGLVQRAEGGFIVCGTLEPDSADEDFFVLQFTAEGLPDPLFQSTGKATVDFSGRADYAHDAVLLPDGSVMVAGSSSGSSYGDRDLGVARLTSAGALHPAFNGGQPLQLNFGPGSEFGAPSAIQSDGKIVIATEMRVESKVCVARYLADGSPDLTFGEEGAITTKFFGHPQDVQIRSDGRVLVTGYRYGPDVLKILVIRLLPDGSPDPSFGGGDGECEVVLSSDGSDELVTAMVLLDAGKILLGGYCEGASFQDLALVRLLESGQMDTTFGVGGKVFTPLGNHVSSCKILVQADGRILAGTSVNREMVVLRYLGNGTPDHSFDGDGKVTAKPGNAYASLGAMGLQEDGKIVVAGTFSNGGQSDTAVLRFLPDGRPDISFNGAGIATTSWLSGYGYDGPSDLVIQKSGRIVVVGGVGDYSAHPNDIPRSEACLTRFMPDGAFDSTFGENATLRLSLAKRTDLRHAHLYPGGRLLVSGTTSDGLQSDVLLVRLDIESQPEIQVISGAVTGEGEPLVDGQSGHHFGTRSVGGLLTAAFSIKNIGERDLTGLSCSIVGEQAGDFVLSAADLPEELAEQQAATFSVSFHPTAEGLRQSTLVIASSDADEGTFEVALSGTGLAANVVEFDAVAHLFREEAGVVNIPVIRPAGSPGIVKVQLQYVNGTAKSGADFTTTMTEAEFGPGVDLVNVPVALLNPPRTPEPVESFTINLVQPSDGAVLGTHTSALITLFDSADAKPPVVALKTPAANARFLEAAGPSVSITGTARSNKGVQRVHVRLNDGAYQDVILTPDAKAGPGGVSFTILVDAAPGPNTVYVRAADRRGDESAPLTRTFTWVLVRPLLVGASGPGTVSAGFVPTSLREVGKRYTISAMPKAGGSMFTGWTVTGADIPEAELEVPGLSFIFRENMTLAAGFGDNPFTGLDGVYTGLLQASRTTPQPSGTAASHQSEGLLTVAVQRTGAFTAKVLSGGQSYSWPGTFTHDGKGRFGARRDPHAYMARKNLPLLRFDLRMNVAGQPGISGIAGDGREVVPAAGGAGGYDLMGDAAFDIQADQAYYNGTARIVPAAYLGDKNAIGLFTAFFPVATPARLPANAFPPGEGLATLSLTKSGAASLAGVLADGTAFTCAAPLAQTLRWPVYAPLYTGKLGSLSGWARLDHTQDDSDFSASGLRWFRPADAKAQHYPSGWSGGLLVDLLGARHRVEPGKSVFPDLDPAGSTGNLNLVCSEGWLLSTMLRPLNLSPSDVVTKLGPNAADYTLTVTRASGRYAGAFTHNLGGSSRQAFQGIIYQKGAHRGGHGFFLSPTPQVKDGLGAGGHARLVLPQ